MKIIIRLSALVVLLLLLVQAAPAKFLRVDSRGYLVDRQSGERVILLEANVPENRLRDMNYAQLDQLWNAGANTIYFTVFGGDDTTVHPWVNRSDKNTYDTAKLAKWRAYAKYWHDKGGICHIVLQEVENGNEIEGGELGPIRRKFYDTMFQTFGDLRVIWLLGEEIANPTAQITAYAQYWKQKDPTCTLSLHTRPKEDYRFEPFVGKGLIDLIAIQSNDQDNGPLMHAWHKRGGWAVYSSERNPPDEGIPPDNLGGITIGLKWLWDGAPVTSGAGMYSGPKSPDCWDLSCPNPSIHFGLYDAWRRSAQVMKEGGNADEARKRGIPVPSNLYVPPGGVIDPTPSPTPTATPTPTPTVTPSPTPTGTGGGSTMPQVGFSFDGGDDGWTFTSAKGFNAPISVNTSGAIAISTASNNNVFGFWESPLTTMPLPSGAVPRAHNLYEVRYRLRSNVAQDRNPTVRLRVSNPDFSESSIAELTSSGTGALTPSASGKTYRQIFSGHDSNRLFRVNFDVLNVDPANAASSTIYMDWVTLINQSSVPFTNQSVKTTLQFSNNRTNGFTARTADPLIQGATLASTAKGLSIKGSGRNPSEAIFGYWGMESNIAIERNTLYEIRYRVSSDATDSLTRTTLPAVRLRVNDSSLQNSVYSNLENSATSKFPVGSTARTYHVWWAPDDAIAGNKMIFSFDYVYSPLPGKNPNLAIYLETLEVLGYSLIP